jgi:hypothetical protein
MRWALLLGTLALTDCSRNTFEVDDPNGVVRSATLELCGSQSALKHDGPSFTTSRWANCEADGEITLVYHNGPTQHCIVGYVTADMPQDFHFRAEQSSCREITPPAS